MRCPFGGCTLHAHTSLQSAGRSCSTWNLSDHGSLRLRWSHPDALRGRGSLSCKNGVKTVMARLAPSNTTQRCVGGCRKHARGWGSPGRADLYRKTDKYFFNQYKRFWRYAPARPSFIQIGARALVRQIAGPSWCGAHQDGSSDRGKQLSSDFFRDAPVAVSGPGVTAGWSGCAETQSDPTVARGSGVGSDPACARALRPWSRRPAALRPHKTA